jgi:hypothetical protein
MLILCSIRSSLALICSSVSGVGLVFISMCFNYSIP